MSATDRTTADLFDDLLEAAALFSIEAGGYWDAVDTSATFDDIRRHLRRRRLPLDAQLVGLAADAVDRAPERGVDLEGLSGAAWALLTMLAARDMSEPAPGLAN